MRYKLSSLFTAAILSISLLGSAPIVDAKSSFSSGGSRSSFSSGGSRSSFSSSRSTAPSRPSAPAKSSFGSSSKPTAPVAQKVTVTSPVKPSVPPVPATAPKAAPQSATQKALADKTKMSGTSTISRQQAVDKFKAENAQKYTTKFASEPKTRPTYVPRRTRVGDRDYDISYNQSAGGYGFYNALGTFMLYDALTDAANSHGDKVVNNYYGTAPTNAALASQQVIAKKDEGMSSGAILALTLVGACVLIGGISLVASRS